MFQANDITNPDKLKSYIFVISGKINLLKNKMTEKIQKKGRNNK